MNKKKKTDPQDTKESIENIATNEGGKMIGTKNSEDFAKLGNLRENLKKLMKS